MEEKCRVLSSTGSQCDWGKRYQERKWKLERGNAVPHKVGGGEGLVGSTGNTPEKEQRPSVGSTGPAPHLRWCPCRRKTSGRGWRRQLSQLMPSAPGWSVPPGARAHIPHPRLVLKASLLHWA